MEEEQRESGVSGNATAGLMVLADLGLVALMVAKGVMAGYHHHNY